MESDHHISEYINISKIIGKKVSNPNEHFYTVIWIIETVSKLMINKVLYKNLTNTMFFLSPKFQWEIIEKEGTTSKGYVMRLSNTILNEPSLKELQINEIRILHFDSIFMAQIAPGIERRLKSILEMLDELMTTNLNHREDAIKALINTFFIYCDGQCNVKISNCSHNHKTVLAYEFVRLISTNNIEAHKVSHYATKLNVSSSYLNECIHYVLGVSAKSLIIEQLVMRTRHALKFTDKSAKEIAYELGFSSPDYFSSFCKKNIGYGPSQYRKI